MRRIGLICAFERIAAATIGSPLPHNGLLTMATDFMTMSFAPGFAK